MITQIFFKSNWLLCVERLLKGIQTKDGWGGCWEASAVNPVSGDGR